MPVPISCTLQQVYIRLLLFFQFSTSPAVQTHRSGYFVVFPYGILMALCSVQWLHLAADIRSLPTFLLNLVFHLLSRYTGPAILSFFLMVSVHISRTRSCTNMHTTACCSVLHSMQRVFVLLLQQTVYLPPFSHAVLQLRFREFPIRYGPLSRYRIRQFPWLCPCIARYISSAVSRTNFPVLRDLFVLVSKSSPSHLSISHVQTSTDFAAIVSHHLPRHLPRSCVVQMRCLSFKGHRTRFGLRSVVIVQQSCLVSRGLVAIGNRLPKRHRPRHRAFLARVDRTWPSPPDLLRRPVPEILYCRLWLVIGVAHLCRYAEI